MDAVPTKVEVTKSKVNVLIKLEKTGLGPRE